MTLCEESFFHGTLVTWLKMCLGNPRGFTSYRDLTDGKLLFELYKQIDSQPFHDRILEGESPDPNTRLNNLEVVFKNVRSFYEDMLNSVILRAPNIPKLAEEPGAHVEEMRVLLLLILGCAMQCPNNNKFISQITSTCPQFQADIAEQIRQIIDEHSLVLSADHLKRLEKTDLFDIIKQMNSQNQCQEICRQSFSPDMSSFFLDRRSHSEFDFSNNSRRSSSICDESQIWKLRNELEKMKTAYLENLEELEDAKKDLEALRDDNCRLAQDAKQLRRYRDKMDIYMERSLLVETLENKVSKLEQKLLDTDSLKSKIKDLTAENEQMLANSEELYCQLKEERSRTLRLQFLEQELKRSQKMVEQLSTQTRQSGFEMDERENEYKEDEKVKTSQPEPDLIASLEHQSLYQEMSMEKDLCTLHQEKIKRLKLKCHKLKKQMQELREISDLAMAEVQRAVELSSEWQCRAVLYETKWLTHRLNLKNSCVDSGVDRIMNYVAYGAFTFTALFVTKRLWRTVFLPLPQCLLLQE